MSSWRQYLHNIIPIVPLFGAAAQPAHPSAADEQPEASRVPCYEPTIEDVFEVKEALAKCRLPIELVDSIIDFAGYWPHTSVRRTGLHAIQSSHNENQFLLRSYPIGFIPRPQDPTHIEPTSQEYPCMEPKPWSNSKDAPNSLTQSLKENWAKKVQNRGLPCRKIVFTIKSHDQGWGGGVGNKGTYKASFTWFDVGLERMCALDFPGITDRDTVSQDDKLHTEFFGERSTATGFPGFKLGPQADGLDRQQVVCTTRTIYPPASIGSQTINAIIVQGNERDTDGFQHMLMPDLHCLQKNKTAILTPTEYKITWFCNDNIDPDSPEADRLEELGQGRGSKTGRYVRELKIGDVVTLWGKARFPGWQNIVEEVGIDIYFSI